ncbi:MAG: enoyl-CoA hydratase [Actinomycetia bacterium]|nr:enoyl-CoA hydratase [Actinomycetes bacterium]
MGGGYELESVDAAPGSTDRRPAAMLGPMVNTSTPESSAEPTIYEVSNGVATITLNMPERKNSLSDVLVNSLGDNLDQAIADDNARVVMLTNNGNTFCAGADLKATAPGVAKTEVRRSFVDVFNMILDSPKPVIGKINGHATGGGVGLVAVCDISIMRDDAKIGFTEVRIGAAPAVISVVGLPKMRRADALELFLTGDRITPARAAEVGLINAVAAPDDLDAAVDRYLSMVVRGGPLALAASKDLVFRVPDMDRDAAFEWTSVRSRELFQSEEASAGIAAFRERKDAPWVPETSES